MKRQTNKDWQVMVLFLSLCLLIPVVGNAQEDLVPQLGQYQGYSGPIYNRWVRTSQYVTVRDGTKLAVDIFRPANSSGTPVEEPLPVIWTHDRYQRAFIGFNGNIITQL